jgi:drug/metabolite transporter (DMT)-like permease
MPVPEPPSVAAAADPAAAAPPVSSTAGDAAAPAALSFTARLERHSLAIALLFIVIWGINFSVQKYVFKALSPGGFLFVRYLIMPVCALVLMYTRYGRFFPPVTRADLRKLAWLGFIGHTVHVGMVTFGIHWSTAFSSSLILSCGPIFTLLILRMMGLERLHGAQVTGVAVAFFGVLVFLSDKFAAGRWQAGGGDLFLLVAASFFSYYTVAAKPLVERLGGAFTMSYATLLGSLPLVLFTFPTALVTDWRAVPASAWVALVWSITVSAFLGWLVWAWVNKVRGVARSAPLMYLMPPVAGLIAWLVSGEHFTVIKLVGAGVALGGVALAQFSGRLPGRP